MYTQMVTANISTSHISKWYHVPELYMLPIATHCETDSLLLRCMHTISVNT